MVEMNLMEHNQYLEQLEDTNQPFRKVKPNIFKKNI